MPAWISNYTHHKMWDEITHPFPSFNVATVEVWKWIRNSTHTFLCVSSLIHARIRITIYDSKMMPMPQCVKKIPTWRDLRFARNTFRTAHYGLWKDWTITLLHNLAWGYANPFISSNGPSHWTFSIVIQILWNIHLTLIPILMTRSLWSFAHGTTAELLSYVPNLIEI